MRITPKTKMVVLNSPANPTGGVTGKAELEQICAELKKHPDIWILSDEIYSRMLYDGAEHFSPMSDPELRDRIILLDGWSKTYAMTGWRLGYAVWPDGLVDHATRLAINCHSCVNAPTQWAGKAALEGPQDDVDMMMAAFAERRQVIVSELNQVPGFTCTEPGGAFYAFPNIEGTGMSARDLQDNLLNETGVAIIAGTSFGAMGEGYVRFSYANSTENIREAIRRVREYLGNR